MITPRPLRGAVRATGAVQGQRSVVAGPVHVLRVGLVEQCDCCAEGARVNTAPHSGLHGGPRATHRSSLLPLEIQPERFLGQVIADGASQQSLKAPVLWVPPWP